MPDVTPRRLRLWGEPGQLIRIDENTLDEARRGLRDDVELADIEQRTADSIDLTLLVPSSFRRSDFDEVVASLRAALGIGAGPYVLIGDDTGEVRGIGGEGRTCPVCRISDGSHVPG